MTSTITRSSSTRPAGDAFAASSPRAAAPSQPVPPEGLARGATGSAVKQLQDRLIDLKLLPGSVKSSSGYGTFGPKTEEAVKAFQKSEGLQQVGSFGPKTHAAMVRHFSAAAPPQGGPAGGAGGGGEGAAGGEGGGRAGVIRQPP